MLSENEFNMWCINNKIGDITKSIIQKIRTSQPSRSVGGGKYNVHGKYPSIKMGLTIQFESHRVEFPAIYLMEHNQDVLEYYDQPPSIKLNYLNKDGKNIGVVYTPDFFVILKDSAIWEEWKTEEELMELSKKSPYRYVKEPDGKWRCPPGEDYANQYGLQFKLRSDLEINWVLQRNMTFLEDYILDNKTIIDENAKNEVISYINNEPGILLADLIDFSDKYDVDNIYLLIVRNEIYANLENEYLGESDLVHIYNSKEEMTLYSNLQQSTMKSMYERSVLDVRVGNKLIWDESIWLIANVGSTSISLIGENEEKLIELPIQFFENTVRQGKIKGVDKLEDQYLNKKIRELIENASEADLADANYRYECIKEYLNGEKYKSTKIPQRTLRYWIKKYKDAQQIYNHGYLGLISNSESKGNRTRKLPEESLQIIEEFIKNHFENIKQKSRIVVYGQLVNECKIRGLIAPSYTTFCNEINKRPKQKLIKERMGNRAAYEYETFYWELSLKTPRHGDRPFEICHIDHTELDLELECPKTGKNLGRCWLSFLLDAYCRRILAFVLTFDPPSYRTNMMLLRECVRLHGRLPQIIVIDGGKDFESVYFETMLAMFQITKKVRPKAKARFGSVIERLFGISNKMFIHNLQGNTQIMKNVRQVTKSVNPKRHAIWSLSRLYERMAEWAFERYDKKEHPALDMQSPRECYQYGIKNFGKRANRFIAYDDIFLIVTLPAPKNNVVKIQPGKGIRINYIYYWNEIMKNPELECEKVSVKYDPFNIGIAYAYIKNKWVKCISEYFPLLNGRTEKEFQMITERIKQQKKNYTKSKFLTAQMIASFISSIEEEEEILTQRYKDMEFKHIFKLDDTASDTVVNSTTNNQGNKDLLKDIKLKDFETYGDL